MGAEKEKTFTNKDNYIAWKVTESDYHEVEDLVKWAVLAPSSHNTQPWQFSIEDNSISISPDLERRLKVSDPTNRELYISLGAAIGNLKIAARYFGFNTEEVVREQKNGIFNKRIQLKNGYIRTKEDEELFDAITKRNSNRKSHKKKDIPQEVKDAISRFEEESNINIEIIEDQKRKLQVGELACQGEEEVFSNQGFREELSNWVREGSTKDFDGMPVSGFTANPILQKGFLGVVRTGMLRSEVAAQSRNLIAKKTTAVAVISGEDGPQSWMEVGETFQKIALKATTLGLAANVLAVLIETNDFPQRLQRLTTSSKRPQMMFRLGYPEEATPLSPRRLIQDVLNNNQKEKVLEESLKPRIYRLTRGIHELENLKGELGEVDIVIDRYDEWLSELFMVKNPKINTITEEGQKKLNSFVEAKNNPSDGVWVYYPWKKGLVHIPEEDEFYELVHSRNYPTIEKDVQSALRRLRIGIAGLSVGRDVAFALLMTGITNLSVADFDRISPSNLNRMGAVSIFEIGENKAESFAKAAYEFNPYLNLSIYPQGLKMENIENFVSNSDVLVDVMDGFPLKNKLRDFTKREGKIVLMATDLGFTPIFDVERPDDPKFGGRVSESVIEGLMRGPRDKKEATRMVIDIIGLENAPKVVLENFINVQQDKQNYWSQIGPTCLVAAGQIAYLVYEIARGNADKLSSFKKIHLEQKNLFDENKYTSSLAEFKKVFGV